jgi:hypothetical protein
MLISRPRFLVSQEKQYLKHQTAVSSRFRVIFYLESLIASSFSDRQLAILCKYWVCLQPDLEPLTPSVGYWPSKAGTLIG